MTSTNAVEELFKDPKAYFREIGSIRAAIGSRDATQKTFKAAFAALGMMLLYGPAEVQDIVQAQLSETTTRETYASMRPGFYKTA